MAYGQKYKDLPFSMRFGTWPGDLNRLFQQEHQENLPTRARADLGSLPRYAYGGRIEGPGIVGEDGPELFVPDRPGTIVPRMQLAEARPSLDDLMSKAKSDAAPAPSTPSLDELLTKSKEEAVRHRGTGKPATGESLFGYEPGVNYEKGAPFTVRYNFFRAEPEKKESYLASIYGPENVRQDRGGRWLIREGEQWMPVLPKGVLETAENIGAGAAGQAPSIVGGLAGGAAGGAALGPPGMIGGAFLGAGGGTFLDELAKKTQGLTDDISWPRVGGEAALAGGFAALPAGKELLKYGATRAASPLLRHWGGVSPEAVDVARTLPGDLRPPVISVAPNLKSIEWHRQVRNKTFGDPEAAPRRAFLDSQIGDILEQFGITGPAKDQAMKEIIDAQIAVSGREAGEALAAGARRTGQGLAEAEYVAREEARRGVEQSLAQLRRQADQPVGQLGEDVAGVYEDARRVFTNNMNELYGNIDRLTGNMSLVNTRAVRQEARNLIDVMEPEAVPPIIRRLAADNTNAPMTFREAHELRTTLREMADFSHSLSPIGQRSGNVRRMAREVDNALMGAQGQTGQEAGRLLREADTAYSQGIQQFTNNKINTLIGQVREGRSPDPSVIADTLLDAKSMDSVRQMWNVLTPELRGRVRTADLRNMLDEAADIDRISGRPTIDGMKLLKAIDSRAEMNEFIYGQAFMRDLREQAKTFAANNGKLDVSALDDPTMIRQALMRANGERRLLEEQAAQDPLRALRSGDPDAIDAAAKNFTVGGNEARTLAGQQMTTPEEWAKVQAYAVKQLFKGMQETDVLGRTIRGGAVEDALGRYTPAQQQALFGSQDRIDNIKLVAKQARMLFPPAEEAGSALAGGQAAGKLKGDYPWALTRMRAALIGRLADSPVLFDMIAGQLRLDPFKARSIMSYLLQASTYVGTDVALNQLSPRGMGGGTRGEIPGLTAPMPGFLGGAKPTPKEPVKYGGPI